MVWVGESWTRGDGATDMPVSWSRSCRAVGLWSDEPVGVDVLGQRRALGVLGDHERLRRLGVGLDHPDRAEAPDPHQRGHLALEAAPEFRVIGQFRAEHLDGHRGTVPADAEIHHAHAARTQPGRQPVMADPPRISSP
jgi:hypothetical protein